MIRRTWVPLLAAALLAGTAQSLFSQPASGLDAVAFMSGCWISPGDDSGTTIEETYTSARGDLVLGMTRYHRNGRVVMFEFTTIAVDSAGIVMTPRPRGTGDVSFNLTETGPARAVFSNPAHDFPKRIVYHRVATDTLVARIEDDDHAAEWRMSPCPGLESFPQ